MRPLSMMIWNGYACPSGRVAQVPERKKRFKLQTGDSGNLRKTERSDVAAAEDGRTPGLGQHALHHEEPKVLWLAHFAVRIDYEDEDDEEDEDWKGWSAAKFVLCSKT